jgi:hypothetical protein
MKSGDSRARALAEDLINHLGSTRRLFEFGKLLRAGAGSMRIGENPHYPRSLSYSELIQFAPRFCRPQSARIARMITHTNEPLSC